MTPTCSSASTAPPFRQSSKLHRLEEAANHRRLGRELGMFTVSEKGDLYHDENEGRSYFEEIG